MSQKDLLERRAAAWSQMKEIQARAFDEGRDFTAEERGAWDKAEKDVTDLTGDIDRLQRAAKLDDRFAELDAEQAEGVKRSGLPQLPGASNGAGDKAAQYERAFGQFLRTGLADMGADDRQLMYEMAQEVRAQGVATGAAGQYTVPQGFWAKVTETLKLYSAVANVAEILRTDTGATLPWATNDDTANTGALLAENTAVTELALTFGTKSLGAYTFTSRLVLVSLQLLQDSGIDVESFVAKKLGQRLGRVHNTYNTTGTGTSQPQGIIAGGTTGKTTASPTAITFPEIIDLIHSVDPAYRNANAKFMFHDLVLSYARKIVDSQGRPLWQPSLQVGAPDQLYGYGYVVNQDMAASVATAAKTMAFGDFSAGFVVRLVNGGQMMRLTERYADNLQVGFFGFDRMDSVVQDPSAYKLLAQA